MLSTLVRERATLCTPLHATARQKLVARSHVLLFLGVWVYGCLLLASQSKFLLLPSTCC